MRLFRSALSRLTWFLFMAAMGALLPLKLGMGATTNAYIIPMAMMFLMTFVLGVYYNNRCQSQDLARAKVYFALSAYFCGATLGALLFVIAWMNYASLIIFVALFVPLALFSLMSFVVLLIAPKDHGNQFVYELFLYLGLFALMGVAVALYSDQIANTFMHTPQLHGINTCLALFLFTAFLFVGIFRVFNINWGNDVVLCETVNERLSNIMAFSLCFEMVNIFNNVGELMFEEGDKHDRLASLGRSFRNLLMFPLGIFMMPYQIYRMFSTCDRRDFADGYGSLNVPVGEHVDRDDDALQSTATSWVAAGGIDEIDSTTSLEIDRPGEVDLGGRARAPSTEGPPQ